MDTKNKKKILIVEDEASLRDALCDKFMHEGFDTQSAKNGNEGLMIALSDQPDMILLDLIMPEMDGMTMLAKLRADSEWGKNVPVILLTNQSAADEKINQVIAEDEPAYYLVKSDWSLSDIVSKVKERLSRNI